jgi:hypothetical protein
MTRDRAEENDLRSLSSSRRKSLMRWSIAGRVGVGLIILVLSVV